MVAESILVKRQLLILNRGHQRAPNLRASDRIVAALGALFIRPTPGLFRDRIKPSTVSNSNMALVKRKYAFVFAQAAEEGSPSLRRRKCSGSFRAMRPGNRGNLGRLTTI
jgi:hypothetical protein